MSVVITSFLVLASAFSLVRERDTCDRADITRWYDWGDTNRIGKVYTQLEGTLHYDFELPETGWYTVSALGFEPGWDRTVAIDGIVKVERYTTPRNEVNTSVRIDGKRKIKEDWNKQFAVFLEKGKHTLSWTRNNFPGQIPGHWRIEKTTGTRESICGKVLTDVVRTTDEIQLSFTAGGTGESAKYDFFAYSLNDATKTNALGSIEFPACEKPVSRDFRCRIPEQGVWRVAFRCEDGSLSFKSDLAMTDLIVIEMEAKAPGEISKTLVAEIDCVKTEPWREKDGESRIVNAPFGSYRESSGTASNLTWGADGFSYKFTLPDINHRYMLEVVYPDDTFRSCAFWLNDQEGRSKKGGDADQGAVLTGGVETGGQYRNTNRMLTHEAYFYPRGTNICIAIANLNRGSFAAASKIRCYQINGDYPAAKAGIRRGRTAGTYFEENGRWKRFFCQDFNPTPNAQYNNIISMERWGEWNRFVGENLMAPTVVAYGGVEYPTKKMDAWGVAPFNDLKCLALVAEKYGCRFQPQITLHGDEPFNRKMGVVAKRVPDPKKPGKDKNEYECTRPEVIEWDYNGSSVIPWRQFSYNCLHPEVQAYMKGILVEIAEMLKDSKSFDAIQIRVPLSWQFTGITGLNNCKYGYGDWTISEFTKDTGIVVPGEGKGRFRERYNFLMKDDMREKWIDWRTARVKAYYGMLRDAVQAVKPGTELIFDWWDSDRGSEAELAECGLDSSRWLDEKGISFFGMQYLFGRRVASIAGVMSKHHALFDPYVNSLSLSGKRTVGIYSDYYECNDNFQWEKFGAPRGVAFDALSPAGDNELAIYAYSLAELDVGNFVVGGNGWIFGTPRLLSPWMREYLSLPKEKMEKIQGLANDPVCFREIVNDEGRFFYAVNLLDTTVDVEIELNGRGELVSATDLMPASKKFTLSAYGLKAFLIKKPLIGKPASVISASLKYDNSVKVRYADQIEFIKTFREDILTRRKCKELPQPFIDHIVADIDSALKGYEENRLGAVHKALTDPKLFFAYSLNGEHPEGAFISGRGAFGGFPRGKIVNAPELKLSRIIGGDPLELPWTPNGFTQFTTDENEHTFGFFGWQFRPQFREFDENGKYIRSGYFTSFAEGSYNVGDRRRGFLRNPQFTGVSSFAVSNGVVSVSVKNGVQKFSLKDNFREIPVAFREQVPVTDCQPNTKFMKPAKENFFSTSVLKVKDGKLCYVVDNKVVSFDPKTGERETLLDSRKRVRHNQRLYAFDFAVDGTILDIVDKEPYGCELNDMLATTDGGFIGRSAPWDALQFFKFDKDGKKGERLFADVFDKRDFRQGNEYAFYRDGSDNIYIAGTGSRKVAAFDKDYQTLWVSEREPMDATIFKNLPWRNPCDLTVDDNGRLWVVDSGLDKLVCLDARTGEFLGEWGFSGTIDDKTGFGFASPSGIAAIGDKLYVLDAGNLRIIEFDLR